MSKQDSIRAKGRVTEALGGDRFRVELDNGISILCHISGKMWQRHIRVIPGDCVVVEMSPYDMTRGRITYRQNVKQK